MSNLKPVRLTAEAKDEIDTAAVVFVSACLDHLSVAITAGEGVMWQVNRASGKYQVFLARIPDTDNRPSSTIPQSRS